MNIFFSIVKYCFIYMVDKSYPEYGEKNILLLGIVQSGMCHDENLLLKSCIGYELVRSKLFYSGVQKFLPSVFHLFKNQ